MHTGSGRKNVVNVYRILAKGTIEEKIVELQERKLQLQTESSEGEPAGAGSDPRGTVGTALR